MTNLFKRFFTHKSKFLLIILCLLGMVFSYSCSCRNDSTGPGNDGNGGGGPKSDTWSFNPKLDLGNTYDISFGSEGDKKRDAVVSFYEPDNYEIRKIEIDEVQDPKNVLTKDKIQHKNNGLTIPQDILKKLAGELTSTDKPATNQVSIVFKLTSTNTTSDDNIKYITNNFNFIKAKKFDSSNIEALLQSATKYSWQFDGYSGEQAHFAITNGTYIANLNTFKIKELDNNLEDTDNCISKSKFQEIKKYLQNSKDTKHYFTSVDVGEPKEKGNTVEFDLTLKFGDIYETDIIMPITVSATKSKGGWMP